MENVDYNVRMLHTNTKWRSVLEFPQKYKMNLLSDVEKYAKEAISKTENKIGKFFKPEQLVYIWCWCVTCVHCNQRFPLLSKMYVAKKDKKKIGIKIIPKNKNFIIEIITNISDTDGKKFTQKGGKAICISCKNSLNRKIVTEDISKNKDKEIVVIQIQTKKGRDFIVPTEEDKKIYQSSIKYFESRRKDFEKENLIPSENILPCQVRGKGNALWLYGIRYWNEYFDERQLLILCTFLQELKKICNKIKDKEYRLTIAIYLSSILAKRIDMSGFGVTWNTSAKEAENILALRRPSMPLSFAESNPFRKSRGSFQNILKSILTGIAFASRLENEVKCNLQSVTTPSETKYDLILTDPPYGDDVQYGELSEFFYVWIYRALKDYFPELPPRIPLDEDFSESWGRFGGQKLAADFFSNGLKKSFVSISDKLKDDGLLVVFFAHSSTETWNLFLESIKISKFKVVSSYAIHTESTSKIINVGKTTFTSSIVVVCRKITKESTVFFEDIIPQIEDKIKKMILQIPDEKLLTLPITDLLIMVYGKVLETCTQHTILKSYQKEFTPDFETLIKDAQSIIIKELVGKLTGRSLNMLGSPTAFYLLTKIFYNGILSSDDALKVARTYGISIDILEKNNIVKKEPDVIRVLYLHEKKLDLKPEDVDRNFLHQQLCYLVQVTKKQGASKIQTILSSKNFRKDDLEQIVSLLIKSFRLRINKNEKLNDDEREELKILEGISDIMGIKITVGKKTTMITKSQELDQYFENT